MKRIINGKKYDTDTAAPVGEYWNGYSPRDFSYLTETLFRKRTGEFFLYGEGGASTKYAERVGNSFTGGECIKPLTEAEARAWSEKHLDGDAYEAIFGEVEE